MYNPIKNWDDRDKKKINKYIVVLVPEHPKSFSGGWYYEHRLALEKHLGRILHSWETVHHIDGNKTNNNIANLFPCIESEHKQAHLDD